MIVKCPVCGKATDVQWPHLWKYKREGMYMCSYGCMRAYDDKKGSNTDMPLNDSQRKTAIDMAMRGESPLKYISEQGIKNPSCTWWNIKQYLSKNDPETYAKLPAKIKGTKAEPKKPETQESVPAPIGGGGWEKIETPEGPVPTCCQPARPSGVTVPEQLPDAHDEAKMPAKKIEKPGMKGFLLPAYIDGFEITGIRGSFGSYMANDEANYFDFYPNGGELCMSPKDWRDQLDELQRAAKVLGVEL